MSICIIESIPNAILAEKEKRSSDELEGWDCLHCPSIHWAIWFGYLHGFRYKI